MSFWHFRSSQVHNFWTNMYKIRKIIWVIANFFQLCLKTWSKCPNCPVGRKIHGPGGPCRGVLSPTCAAHSSTASPVRLPSSSKAGRNLEWVPKNSQIMSNRMGNGGTLFTSTLLNTSWHLLGVVYVANCQRDHHPPHESNLWISSLLCLWGRAMARRRGWLGWLAQACLQMFKAVSFEGGYHYLYHCIYIY